MLTCLTGYHAGGLSSVVDLGNEPILVSSEVWLVRGSTTLRVGRRTVKQDLQFQNHHADEPSIACVFRASRYSISIQH